MLTCLLRALVFIPVSYVVLLFVTVSRSFLVLLQFKDQSQKARSMVPESGILIFPVIRAKQMRSPVCMANIAFRVGAVQ